MKACRRLLPPFSALLQSWRGLHQGPQRDSHHAVAGRHSHGQFEKYTLPNGLEVILSENHRLRRRRELWYHVGPANEDPGETASPTCSRLSSRARARQGDSISAAGGRRRQRSERTTDSIGQLFRDGAAIALTRAWLESDRMVYCSTRWIRQPPNQQDVVRNERRQSVENQPYGIVEEELFHQCSPHASYYANVIGSHADIRPSSWKT